MDVIENGLIEAADLYYLGDWVAGTYKEGDIVVYNGVAYVAVRQTTQTPVPWAAGQASLSYGTTLPANPVDGQEAILVDSVTNPTYQWRFRYNAQSTSAYKWEFIGGKWLVAAVETAEGSASPTGAWYDLPTPGPDFVAPRAGEYMMECRTNSYTPSSTGAIIYGVAIPETATPSTAGLQVADMVDSWGRTTASGWNVVTMTAGQRARMRYYQSAASTSFGNRRLTVYPARVS